MTIFSILQDFELKLKIEKNAYFVPFMRLFPRHGFDHDVFASIKLIKFSGTYVKNLIKSFTFHVMNGITEFFKFRIILNAHKMRILTILTRNEQRTCVQGIQINL